MPTQISTACGFHRDGTLPLEFGWTFVFGSNDAGRHGRGAALVARQVFGAAYGVGRGPTGRTYAIATKDARLVQLPLSAIRPQVEAFLGFAAAHPTERFWVTRVGCGLAGHDDAAVAPMFAGSGANCSLPEEWRPLIQPSS